MKPNRTRTGSAERSAKSSDLAAGDKVLVAGAGREWAGKIVARRLPDGRESIHPQYDDTAVFVMFDDTGISMAVSVRQVSIRGKR